MSRTLESTAAGVNRLRIHQLSQQSKHQRTSPQLTGQEHQETAQRHIHYARTSDPYRSMVTPNRTISNTDYGITPFHPDFENLEITMTVGEALGNIHPYSRVPLAMAIFTSQPGLHNVNGFMDHVPKGIAKTYPGHFTAHVEVRKGRKRAKWRIL